MRKNQTNYDEIQDKHLDTMIKLAFQYADALEAQENTVKDDEYPVDEERKNAVWAMTMEKLAQRNAAEKKEKRIMQFSQSIPRIIQIAACLVLVMGIVTPFAIANVEIFRAKVMQLLINIQEDHTELLFIENEEAAYDVPVDWGGMYYPSYIPDGFSLTDIGVLYCDVLFTASNGDYICFSEYQQDAFVDINSENGDLSYASIHGKNAFIIVRDSITIVTWSTDERFFVLETKLSKSEAFAVAEGVRKISFE